MNNAQKPKDAFHVGRFISRFLDQNDMTAAELGRLAGVPEPTIYRMVKAAQCSSKNLVPVLRVIDPKLGFLLTQ